MESLNNSTCVLRTNAHCVRTRRDGKIAIVTMFAILGLIVLAGFIGNVGHVVTNKIAAQNAADAVTFSTAQWMARGMNAVTATNHLLGEATALVVVIEGLGGPEVDLEMVDYPDQCSITDDVNRSLVELAIIQGNPAYGTQLAAKIDKPLVESVVKRIVSRDDDEKKHRAFATIFDSKLILKKATTKRLLVKFFANFLFLVPPPWGYLAAIGAYATHAVADAQLISIGIEYVYLHVMEKLITKGGLMKKLKVDVLEEKIIPALAAHGDYLAGRPSKKVKNKPTKEAGVVNNAVRNTLNHLGEIYNVKTAVYPLDSTVPGIANLRLPIEPEAPPANKGTKVGKEEDKWGNDELNFEDPDDQLEKVFKEMAEKKKKILERIEELQKQVATLKELKADVEDLEKRTGVNNDEKTAFAAEKTKISTDITKKEAKIKEYTDDYNKLVAQEKQMRDKIASLKQAPPGSGNISARREHLALEKMDQAEERYTQWVRATYPYVDAFRAPILKLFEEHLERCEATKHYEKWTNRYTLVKSWKFRSGFRFKLATSAGTDKNRGKWENDPKTELLTMYLMAQRFDAKKGMETPKPGAVRIAKGTEVWTKDTEEGKQMAEEMFTVIGMTQREFKPLFSPVIYPVASRLDGITTFAQAVFYNANEQVPPTDDAKTTVQPKIAWDTLNWLPTAKPPEWGAKATVAPKSIWPWEIFTPDPKLLGNAQARLNWQAKLMPVTKSRLTQAIPAGAASLEPVITVNVTVAVGLYDQLVTH